MTYFANSIPDYYKKSAIFHVPFSDGLIEYGKNYMGWVAGDYERETVCSNRVISTDALHMYSIQNVKNTLQEILCFSLFNNE